MAGWVTLVAALLAVALADDAAYRTVCPTQSDWAQLSTGHTVEGHQVELAGEQWFFRSECAEGGKKEETGAACDVCRTALGVTKALVRRPDGSAHLVDIRIPVGCSCMRRVESGEVAESALDKILRRFGSLEGKA